MAYALGYALNVAALFLLVDLLGYPHQVVQGLLILAVAVLLFILQKFWIFGGARRRSNAPRPAP